jgi:hypothetical protein
MNDSYSVMYEMAEQIASNVDVDGTVSDDGMRLDLAMIVTILTTVFPLLFDMPCFNGKSPKERQDQLVRHPNLARAIMASKLRREAKNWTRKQSFAVADSALDQFVSLPPARLEAFSKACLNP